jgi:hypothetical protein
MIRVWQAHGELYGMKRVYGIEDPPVNSPDGVKAYFAKSEPDFIIEKVIPHPGGISVVKRQLSDAAEQTLQKKDEVEAALRKVVEGAKWDKTITTE